jgi:hypothetical protein
MILLMRVIEDHHLVGICNVIPDWIFQGLFGNKGPNMSNPYPPSFYGIVWSLLQYQKKVNVPAKTEFVFDNQPGQVEKVLSGWEGFRSSIRDPEIQAIVGNPPSFQNDLETVALQAADMMAGWTRTRYEQERVGVKPVPPWGSAGGSVLMLLNEWTPELGEAYYKSAYGRKPIRQYFKYGYGVSDAEVE